MSELPVQYIKFIFPVDKVSSNVAFLCQNHYDQVLNNELVLNK